MFGSGRKAAAQKKAAEEATQKFLAEKFLKEAAEAAAEAEKEVVLALRSAAAAQSASDSATRAEEHAKNAENYSEKAFAASSVTEVAYHNATNSLTSQGAKRVADGEVKYQDAEHKANDIATKVEAAEDVQEKKDEEEQRHSPSLEEQIVKLHALKEPESVLETEEHQESNVSLHESASSSSSISSASALLSDEETHMGHDEAAAEEVVRVVLPLETETPHAITDQDTVTKEIEETSQEFNEERRNAELPQQQEDIDKLKQDIALLKQQNIDDERRRKEGEEEERLKDDVVTTAASEGVSDSEEKRGSADKQVESESASVNIQEQTPLSLEHSHKQERRLSLAEERHQIDQLLHGQEGEKQETKAEGAPGEAEQAEAMKADENSWAQQEEVRREQEEKVKREEEEQTAAAAAAAAKAKIEEEIKKLQEVQRKEQVERERQQQEQQEVKTNSISSPTPSEGPTPVAKNSRSGRRPPPPPPKPASMTSPTPKSPEISSASSTFLTSPIGSLALSPSSPALPLGAPNAPSLPFETVSSNHHVNHSNVSLSTASVISTSPNLASSLLEATREAVDDVVPSMIDIVSNITDKVTTAITSTNNDLSNSVENSEALSRSADGAVAVTDAINHSENSLSSRTEQARASVTGDDLTKRASFSESNTASSASSLSSSAFDEASKASSNSLLEPSILTEHDEKIYLENNNDKNNNNNNSNDNNNNSNNHTNGEQQSLQAVPKNMSLEVERKSTTVSSSNPLSAFEVLRVVGKGRFAKVVLVRRLSDNVKFAVKIMEKAFLIQQNQVANVMSERRVLEQLRHPFLMSLCFAFETTDKLYLGLEFVEGGELFFHGQQQPKRRFSEEVVRLWAAELTLALGHLHSVNTVFRDLKPENVLLDLEGHVHLTDFGLAKDLGSVSGKTQTFCGAKEYLAPEVIQGLPYGFSVDWWTLGILIYELTVGLPPFFSRNTTEMYAKILHADLRFPPFLSPECVHLVRLLLERDPTQRLGSRKDVEELQAHPFFAQGRSGADLQKFWEDVYRKAIPSNLRPTESNNGHQQFEGEKVEDESGLPDEDADRSFTGFEYNQELF